MDWSKLVHPVESFCEDGNELYGWLNDMEFLGQVNDCQLHKKDSVP
jgi:hypothetical protein